MPRIFRAIVKRTPLYPLAKRLYSEWEIARWKYRGKYPPTPHLRKQRIVKSYAKRFSLHVLVETGTHVGEMVAATKDTFREIHTIELSHALYEQARQRFAQYDHISVLQGSSDAVMADIIHQFSEPCLFWLDAHYSGGNTAKGESDTPILGEVNLILTHLIRNHVLLIDDAREFTGENDYPSLEELQNLVAQHRPQWKFEVRDDIIRIHK